MYLIIRLSLRLFFSLKSQPGRREVSCFLLYFPEMQGEISPDLWYDSYDKAR